MEEFKISFLMTIYNHQDYLKESIESILNQTYKNWELIAIDNGSSDNSKKILKNIRNKKIKTFFLKKNIGRTNCLNFGLKKCSGDFIAIQDSDDIAHKERIKFQIKEFKKDKKLSLLFTDYSFINAKKVSYPILKLNLIKSLFNPRTFLYRNPFAHSSSMYKAEIIKEIGGYPKIFLYAQDYAFFLKILKAYKVNFLKKRLVKIRIQHKRSETYRSLKSNIETKELIKLLLWNINNFNTTFVEKIFICFRLMILLMKFFLPK